MWPKRHIFYTQFTHGAWCLSAESIKCVKYEQNKCGWEYTHFTHNLYMETDGLSAEPSTSVKHMSNKSEQRNTHFTK